MTVFMECVQYYHTYHYTYSCFLKTQLISIAITVFLW